MNDDNEDKKKDPISESLGINPLQKTTSSVRDIMEEAKNDSALKDFESARANIHNVIETAKDAIEKLAEIAEAGQQPRAYEVLSKLIDTTVAANKSLLEMQEKIRSLNNIENTGGGSKKTINNNLFVGSTAELQKIIQNMKNQE